MIRRLVSDLICPGRWLRCKVGSFICLMVGHRPSAWTAPTYCSRCWHRLDIT